MKKAMIVASFGTSSNEAYKKTINSFIDYLKLFNHEEVPIIPVFTSNVLRSNNNSSHSVASIEEVLQQLKEENYDIVNIISFFIIPGNEFEKVQKAVKNYQDDFTEITLSNPLLTTEKDFEELVKCLKESTTFSGLTDPQFLFVGHGSKHKNNQAYKILNKTFEAKGMLNYKVACLEGEPYITEYIDSIDIPKDNPLIVMPLLLFNGEHVTTDLINGPNSVKTKLEAKGYNPIIVPIGLGEINSIHQLFINHLIKSYE